MDVHALTLSKWFCILPSNWENPETKEMSTTSKLRAISAIIVITLAWVWRWSMYYRVAFMYDDLNGISLVDAGLVTYLSITYISFIIIGTLTHKQSWTLLKLSTGVEETRSGCGCKFQFYMIASIYFIYGGTMIYIGVCFTSVWLCMMILALIGNFIVVLTTLNINGFASTFAYQLKRFKYRIKEDCRSMRQAKSLEINPYVILQAYSRRRVVEKHGKVFIVFCRGIRAFNSIYGLQILAIFGIALFITTDCVKLLVNVLVRETIVNDFSSTMMISWKVWQSCTLMVISFALVSPCVKITKEVDDIIKHIVKLLIELPHGIEDPILKFNQHKLIFLMKQLEHHKPYMTAGGVFEIDYSVFMHIVSGVITFVVVFIQLSDV